MDTGIATEAWLYTTEREGTVRCHLCAHECVIRPGRFGICQVRENQGGRLVTHVFGRTVSEHVDPIEKKPLYHFHPGSISYSIATPGCNFRCPWCQNWSISQAPREHLAVPQRVSPPEAIVAAAVGSGSRSISYTYTEPTIFFEYACETARLAHQRGLGNVFVTNGYMTRGALQVIRPYLDAANVDLKAFREATYRRHIGARLQPVQDALITMKSMGIWVEVTTLLIPGLNDDPQELRDLARFLVDELGPETPWHISRFFPTYKMSDRPPTPVETLRRAYEIGREEGLCYVYLGNIPSTAGANTLCPGCGETLIERWGMGVMRNHVRAGTCPTCGRRVEGRGMSG